MSALRRLGTVLLRPLRSYDAAAKRHPLRVGIATTVVKTSIADIFAQKVMEGKDDIDWRRNALFSSFGFFYLSLWQYYLYNSVFTRMTPALSALVGQRAVAPVLTWLDQCVHHPLMYFPCFYLLRGSMHGEQPAESLSKCQSDMWDNLKALWSVWVPAQLVNFSVVPLHLRVPFVAGVSFAWTVILSVLRGTLKHAALPEEAGAEAVAGAGVQAASGPSLTVAYADSRTWEGEPAGSGTTSPLPGVKAVAPSLG